MGAVDSLATACGPCVTPLLHLSHIAFKSLVFALPPNLRYALSILAFWPTLLWSWLLINLFPASRHAWDAVVVDAAPSPKAPAAAAAPTKPGRVLLGSAPISSDLIKSLYTDEGVRGIVNMCREWNAVLPSPWHAARRRLFRSLPGLEELWCPTTDYHLPSYAHCVQSADFIQGVLANGGSVFVHCKAGRGRSLVAVLAWLAKHRRVHPRDGLAMVRRVRPHVSDKAGAPVLIRLWEEATAAPVEGKGVKANAAEDELDVMDEPDEDNAPLVG